MQEYERTLSALGDKDLLYELEEITMRLTDCPAYHRQMLVKRVILRRMHQLPTTKEQT
jgi:hypothetical protein